MIKNWVLLAMVGLVPALAAAQNSADIEFENVWVRAMPPFHPNSAGYFTLTNHRDSAIAIVSASSNVAKSTELHTTRKVDGLMRMEQLDGLAVAPGERIELAPGGTHLMLFDLVHRLVPGDDVELCLLLASQEVVCSPAEIRKTGDAPGHKH